MEFREFEKLMGELRDYYGEKGFPPKSATVIFRLVKDLTPGEFSQVIEQLTEQEVRAPSPAVIKRQAQPLINRARERRQRQKLEELERSGTFCVYCGHSGYVTALKRTSPCAEFSFRCPFCPATKVRRQSEKIPFWSDEWKADFVPVSFRKESYEAASKFQRAHCVRRGTGAKGMSVSETEILAMLDRARREPERED
jgi:ribosomal protein L37AE/L43A